MIASAVSILFTNNENPEMTNKFRYNNSFFELHTVKATYLRWLYSVKMPQIQIP